MTQTEADARELRRLLGFMTRPGPPFGLALALYADARQAAAAQLELEELGAARGCTVATLELDFHDGERDLVGSMRDASAAGVDVLFVCGLELLVVDATGVQRHTSAVANLNQRRDELPSVLEVRVVFWLPQTANRELSEVAWDLLQVMMSHAEFTGTLALGELELESEEELPHWMRPAASQELDVLAGQLASFERLLEAKQLRDRGDIEHSAGEIAARLGQLERGRELLRDAARRYAAEGRAAEAAIATQRSAEISIVLGELDEADRDLDVGRNELLAKQAEESAAWAQLGVDALDGELGAPADDYAELEADVDVDAAPDTAMSSASASMDAPVEVEADEDEPQPAVPPDDELQPSAPAAFPAEAEEKRPAAGSAPLAAPARWDEAPPLEAPTLAAAPAQPAAKSLAAPPGSAPALPASAGAGQSSRLVPRPKSVAMGAPSPARFAPPTPAAKPAAKSPPAKPPKPMLASEQRAMSASPPMSAGPSADAPRRDHRRRRPPSAASELLPRLSVTTAQVHARKGKREDSRAALQEALMGFEALGDEGGRAEVFGHMAALHEDAGEYAAALELRRERELPAYLAIGDVEEAARTRTKIAELLARTGEIDPALRLIREQVLPAIETLDSPTAPQGQAVTTLAAMLDAAGQPRAAAQLLAQWAPDEPCEPSSESSASLAIERAPPESLQLLELPLDHRRALLLFALVLLVAALTIASL